MKKQAKTMPNSKAATRILRALDNPLRWEIIKFINQKGETVVAPIYKTLKIDQSICSQHLAILRDAGFIVVEKVGQQRSYSLNYEKLKAVNLLIENLSHGDH